MKDILQAHCGRKSAFHVVSFGYTEQRGVAEHEVSQSSFVTDVDCDQRHVVSVSKVGWRRRSKACCSVRRFHIDFS